MLRLSKKADYALIAMAHLARQPGSTSAREIAETYEIPAELMAKVLQRLVQRGLLASQQGARGGYHLADEAERISVADVIEAIDGPVSVTACSAHGDHCGQYEKCTVRDPLWRISNIIVSALAGTSVSDLAGDVAAAAPDAGPRRAARFVQAAVRA